MAGPLDGTVGLVTGAASGLGRAIAARFAAEGAMVACADRDTKGLATLVAEIEAGGGAGLALVGDVTSAADQQGMVEDTVSAFGSLHIAVAGAGIHGEGSALETDALAWDRVLAVNLTGVWLTAQATIPAIIASGGGSLITIASISSLFGLPNQVAYAAAKGGVLALTRQLAADYARHGVRVNAICPATVPTPLVESAYLARAGGDEAEAREMLEQTASRYPLGRLGDVADIAGIALFLASRDASWITGQAHVVDGGLTSIVSTSHDWHGGATAREP